jgi:hypothetical protein
MRFPVISQSLRGEPAFLTSDEIAEQLPPYLADHKLQNAHSN